MSFWSSITSFFTSFNAKIKAFFASPGGAIVQQALTNVVRIAGAEASSLLMQMAQNQVNGKPVLGDIQWTQVANSMKSQAIAQGISFTETMIDFAISQAAMANAVPGALPAITKATL